MFDLGAAFLDRSLLMIHLLLLLGMSLDVDNAKNFLLLGYLIELSHTIRTHDPWWTHTWAIMIVLHLFCKWRNNHLPTSCCQISLLKCLALSNCCCLKVVIVIVVTVYKGANVWWLISMLFPWSSVSCWRRHSFYGLTYWWTLLLKDLLTGLEWSTRLTHTDWGWLVIVWTLHGCNSLLFCRRVNIGGTFLL